MGYAKFLFMYFGLKINLKNIKTPLIIEQELCIQIDTFYVTIKQSQYMFLISSIWIYHIIMSFHMGPLNEE